MNNSPDITGTEIAIVGMTGRFPGARNLAEFWENLCQGIESIRPVTDKELLRRGVPAARLRDPRLVKVSAALEDMELFDATFFGYTPREAELMDPQHRIFLECAWEALEQAGYNPEKSRGTIGVFAGATTNTYLLYNLMSNLSLLTSLDPVQIDVNNGADYLATRASYKLNLMGPSCTIQTACSTSLVAVHLACQSLLNQECDMALAGGVSIHVKHPKGYQYLEGGIVSPDGHCRAFDAKAAGTVFGSGVGVVALKRLEDALADGDHIHAVILGSAINNDGAGKVGYTAPSVEGQAAVITEALAVAGVPAETIQYVETHGTATPMGDPIEVRALTKAYRTQTAATHTCAIGSVKSNIGHLAGAAGVVSLIKAVLALEHQLIPPSLHFEHPSAEIDFERSPFYVNDQLTAWKTAGTPRRAGVSSFGIGGTNAHLILEEAPVSVHEPSSRPAQVLLLSAKTGTALEAATDNLVEYLKRQRDVNLADVAYTLQVGRQAFSQRRVVICNNPDDAIESLTTRHPSRVFTAALEIQDRPTVFMFTGQGAQYVNMARGLYESEPVFREQVDRCAELFRSELGSDLRDVIYPMPEQFESAAQLLNQTRFTQPALFAIEYALAQMWQAWGVHPQAMIGHSIGEYVAACLAGVMCLEDAVALVAARGRLMQELPAGAMLAVTLPAAELQTLLPPALSIAAINAPTLTVVSGPIDSTEALQQHLLKQDVACQRLHTSHAFHSAMMDPILPAFTERVRRVALHAPQIPYISNVTGTWITTSQATDPAYWAQHLRQAVRFSAGLRTLLQTPDRVWLEVGPGNTLTKLAKQHSSDPRLLQVYSSIRHPQEPQADDEFLLATIGKLWLSGVSVNWPSLHAHEHRQRVPLPTYPFERQRYWIEPGIIGEADAASALMLKKKTEIADWFYLPSWKSSRLPRPFNPRELVAGQRWLLFVDEQGVGMALAERLRAAGQEIITVKVGRQFDRLDETTYTLDPRQPAEYGALLAALEKIPDRIVHLWSLTAHRDTSTDSTTFDHSQTMGFYSLLFLAQALGAQDQTPAIQIEIVSTDLQRVAESDPLQPEKATLLSAGLIIPREYPNVTCRCIDCMLTPTELTHTRSIDLLLAELQAQPTDRLLAYRGNRRWVQTFEPLRLETEREPLRVLRPKGVYLITGGLTGVGLSLAKHLAQSVQARLILVQDVTQIMENTKQVVHDLEVLGAQVFVAQADLAEAAQLLAAIAEGVARFGKIQGVIHAAGVTDAQALATIQETHEDVCLRHFRLKVYGLLALEQAVRDFDLDFCILNSSLSTVLGGLGYMAYAAADLFMDAYAQAHNEDDGWRWLSIDWDAWRLGAETEQIMAAQSDWMQLALTPEEGSRVFDRLLSASTTDRVVISTSDLPSRLKQEHQKSQAARTVAPLALHARPNLPVTYLAPRNDLERRIADIWQQVLGIQQVGIHDNFFELGGHSLLATQLRNQLYETFKVEFPIRNLFENATVAGVAQLIEAGLARADTRADVPIAERLKTAFPTERLKLVSDYLKRKVADGLNLAPEEPPADGDLTKYDLELVAVDLMWNLKQDFNLQFYPHEITVHAQLLDLARYVLAEIDRMADLPRLATALPLSAYRLKPYRKRMSQRTVIAPAHKIKPMVFVHSSPRAGSTLLRIMLAGHPELFCPPELNLLFFEDMQEWHQNIGFGHELEWTSAGVQWAFMELQGLESEAGQAFVDDLVQRNESAQQVYARLQELSGARWLVDKTPTYAMDLDTLERAETLFDRPKYIYLFRHPYPVMDSLLRIRLDKLFGPSLFEDHDVDPYVVAETVWAISNRNLLQFFDRIDPERYHWIRYEDLVSRPAEVMRELCRFLDVPFHEGVLRPYDGRRERMIGGLGDPNILQHTGIDAQLSEAWKKINWPRLLDASTQQLVARLGYELPKGGSPVGATAELLANLGNLSDEEVREMLQQLRAEEEGN